MTFPFKDWALVHDNLSLLASLTAQVNVTPLNKIIVTFHFMVKLLFDPLQMIVYISPEYSCIQCDTSKKLIQVESILKIQISSDTLDYY